MSMQNTKAIGKFGRIFFSIADPFMNRIDLEEFEKHATLGDFQAPDLSIPEGEDSIKKQLESQVIVGGNFYKERVVIECERSNPQSGIIAVELYDSSGERALAFEGTLLHDRPSQYSSDKTKYTKADSDIHSYWRVYYRRVLPEARNRGLGQFGVEQFEQVVEKTAEKNPGLGAEWIEYDTRLASLVKLLIDQKWLKDHGLEKFASSSGRDLGYVPHPKDEDLIAKVLANGAIKLHDLDVLEKEGVSTPQVRMIKTLK